MAIPARLVMTPPTPEPTPATVWTLARYPARGRHDGRPVGFCPTRGVWVYLDTVGAWIRGAVAVRVVGN